MPINSKEKGKRGERDAVKFLRGSGFRNARRSQQYSGNDGTADIIVPELAYIHIEVKFRFDIGVGTCVLDRACSQSSRDADGRSVPVVLWRKSGDRQWKLTYMDDRTLQWGTVCKRRPITTTLIHLNGKKKRESPPNNDVLKNYHYEYRKDGR